MTSADTIRYRYRSFRYRYRYWPNKCRNQGKNRSSLNFYRLICWKLLRMHLIGQEINKDFNIRHYTAPETLIFFNFWRKRSQISKKIFFQKKIENFRKIGVAVLYRYRARGVGIGIEASDTDTRYDTGIVPYITQECKFIILVASRNLLANNSRII